MIGHPSVIEIGSAAPDVTLRDEEQQPVALSAFWEQQPVAIVFVRHFG